MNHPCDRHKDRQTDGRTDGIAIAYARLQRMLSRAKTRTTAVALHCVGVAFSVDGVGYTTVRKSVSVSMIYLSFTSDAAYDISLNVVCVRVLNNPFG